jgi:ornithine carbamoyltransferase
MRAFKHQTVVDLAGHATCSVINGLTDFAHPCQALADLYTLKELIGRLSGLTLAYVGDGNNVARSLAEGCGRVGMRFVMATPTGYRFDETFLAELESKVPDLDLHVTDDPAEAVRDAVAVYTDVWTSMGQEAETAKRLKIFAPYQVNDKLMSRAPKGCYFMHCLPAHRGEEVTDAVIDGPSSIVVQQAANRLHVQKGILAWVLGAQR